MRKKLLLALTFVLGMNVLNAQEQNLNVLVSNQKEAGASFEKVTLFERVKPGKTSRKLQKGIPSEFKNYTLLSLKKSFLSEKGRKVVRNANTIDMSIPYGDSNLELELVKVDIAADNFSIVEMPSGKDVSANSKVTHYRGIIKGSSKSVAAITVFDDEVSGVVSGRSVKGGNIVIARLDNSDKHIIYADGDIAHLQKFACKVTQEVSNYTKEELEGTVKSTSRGRTNKAPKVLLDVGNDIVRNKGSREASKYIQAIFNQVAVLYANESITLKLGGLKIWTSKEPFSDLDSYTDYRRKNGIEGSNIGHYVLYNHSGGIAWVNTLCNSNYSFGVSGISKSYSEVPTYSWSVNVVTHELGHNLGSSHTHACAWNGNNTAIDGCYNIEGSCSNPGYPSEGGTIMSYCHLVRGVGINLSNGFGSQPGNLIRTRVSQATCLDSSTGGDDDVDTNSCKNVEKFSSTKRYNINDKVVYQGRLYIMLEQGWKFLGNCSSNMPNLGKILEAKEFELYPNPVENTLNVMFNSTVVSTDLYIYDINGNVLKKEILQGSPTGVYEANVNVSQLPTGVYVLKLVNTERTIEKKFVVK